jgi:hypothetical protein
LFATGAFLASRNLALADEKTKITDPLSVADAKKLSSPIPYSKKPSLRAVACSRATAPVVMAPRAVLQPHDPADPQNTK